MPRAASRGRRTAPPLRYNAVQTGSGSTVQSTVTPPAIGRASPHPSEALGAWPAPACRHPCCTGALARAPAPTPQSIHLAGHMARQAAPTGTALDLAPLQPLPPLLPPLLLWGARRPGCGPPLPLPRQARTSGACWQRPVTTGVALPQPLGAPGGGAAGWAWAWAASEWCTLGRRLGPSTLFTSPCSLYRSCNNSPI